jgi:uncharacterized protein
MRPARVAIVSDGRSLVGYMFETEASALRSSRPGVLFIHGSGSSQRRYADRARAVVAATGGAALTFDLTAHGESVIPSRPAAPVNVSDHLADVTGAYDELSAVHGVDRIGVCGASYGAYLAVLLTARRRVSRLLLRAPAQGDDSLRRACLEAYDGPVMIVESGADEVVGRETIRAYLAELGRVARHKVINGASHELTHPEWQQQFQDLIVEWFTGL